MAYTQDNSPFAMTTDLGKDKLLLVGFSGHEAISQLFNFQLDVAVDNTIIGQILGADNAAFGKLLGSSLTIEARLRGRKRHFNGICSRVTQGDQDAHFTYFRIDMVPKLWLLTKRIRSRIFQGLTVPQILDSVFQGTRLDTESRDPKGPALDVKYQWQKLADFKKRDYCVQYRETDFNFACRLMEEEGIHYYFVHTSKKHELVVTDFPAHPSIFGDGQAGTVVFTSSATQETLAKQESVVDWKKMQELRSGKVTLRDYSFEMLNKGQPAFLEESAASPADIQVGKKKHALHLAFNTTQLEIYEYPGEYVQRFDAISRGGGDRPGDIDNIIADGPRTANIRMQEEVSPAVLVAGTSNSPLFCAGLTFIRSAQDKPKEAILQNDGEYLLTGVAHFASGGGYQNSGGSGTNAYHNSFTCVPTSATFRRPPRATPKPFVQGAQTAIVVGPAGAEIATDKFGRVKVKFHWDRDDRQDDSSSCWVRVAQAWAGNRWGASFWPRVGQEVVVAFLEGDPDQPIIIGSVYNSVQMPPYLGAGLDSKHAEDNKISGIKSNTTLGGEGFNEWRFDDNKGKEQIFFHAERNMDTRVKNDSIERVIHDRSLIVGAEKDGEKSGDQKEKVFKDKHLHVMGNQEEHIGGNFKLMIGHGDGEGGLFNIVIEKTKKELIEENSHLHIKKNQAILVDGFLTEIVKGNHAEAIGGEVAYIVKKDLNEKIGGTHNSKVSGDVFQIATGNHGVDADNIHLKAGQKIIIEAGTQISLVVGANFIDIGPSGISIVGSMVNINSGGAAGKGPGFAAPQFAEATQALDAEQAAPVEPAIADDSKSGQKSAPAS